MLSKLHLQLSFEIRWMKLHGAVCPCMRQHMDSAPTATTREGLTFSGTTNRPVPAVSNDLKAPQEHNLECLYQLEALQRTLAIFLSSQGIDYTQYHVYGSPTMPGWQGKNPLAKTIRGDPSSFARKHWWSESAPSLRFQR